MLRRVQSYMGVFLSEVGFIVIICTSRNCYDGDYLNLGLKDYAVLVKWTYNLEKYYNLLYEQLINVP